MTSPRWLSAWTSRLAGALRPASVRSEAAPAHHDWQRSSDLRRPPAMAVIAMAAAAGVLVTLLTVRSQPEPSQGPLSLPHREAQLGCRSCHGDSQTLSQSCITCHGQHRSTRPGHRALAAKGALNCTQCHAVHQRDAGVRLTPGASVARLYDLAGERVTSTRINAPQHAITVPLVPLSLCARCHDLAAFDDPIQRCRLPAPAPSNYNVCFDEHHTWEAQAPRGEAAACAKQHGADRHVAWQTARAVASRAPVVRHGPPAWWLFGGLLGALTGSLGLVISRARTKRRTPKRDHSTKPITKLSERRKLPQIDPQSCLGCGGCVDACPYSAIHIEAHLAVVNRPEHCCGLALCASGCPNGSLRVIDGGSRDDGPCLDASLQATERPGVYLAGEVTGLPLIKNAIRQGAEAVDHIAASLPPGHRHALDLLIVGAGPAGLSAALRAKELGLRFKVIEQHSVAHSIRSFPRNKLVFDQPLALPLVGDLWFEECHKETLVERWSQLIRRHQLPIAEGQRLVGLHPQQSGFEARVHLSEGQREGQREGRYGCARVLLATGIRASPRKLPMRIAKGAEAHLSYQLDDARQLAGKRVVIVGLGDSALEAASMLARQRDTKVVLVHRGQDFSRGGARNVAEVKRLVAEGRIQLELDTKVMALERNELITERDGKVLPLPCDALLVLIGSQPPKRFLREIGIERSH